MQMLWRGGNARKNCLLDNHWVEPEIGYQDTKRVSIVL